MNRNKMTSNQKREGSKKKQNGLLMSKNLNNNKK
jgi:hypothetical protein